MFTFNGDMFVKSDCLLTPKTSIDLNLSFGHHVIYVCTISPPYFCYISTLQSSLQSQNDDVSKNGVAIKNISEKFFHHEKINKIILCKFIIHIDGDVRV